MRVDFIPKPLHWSPFSILILHCADQTKNMNCFVYLTQIIIAVIVNDVQQCETQKDRTGGMQGNPVLKAVLSCNDTPPIAEILCVKNGRAIVVCGFLMK